MDFTVIKHAVQVDHGVKHLSMRFIKQLAAPDRARLSAELCAQITKELGNLGLITLPRRLPTSENDSVLVIEKTSTLGQAVTIASKLAEFDRIGGNPLPSLFENHPGARDALTP
ncbi:hypothetical protein [Streptomyces sp. NPDC046727]|uniref:hypothetical protein n=1 Tax=Streptomyces sp. NPDC046727 TaxID=3155373 RepID=UPI0033CE6E0F